LASYFGLEPFCSQRGPRNAPLTTITHWDVFVEDVHTPAQVCCWLTASDVAWMAKYNCLLLHRYLHDFSKALASEVRILLAEVGKLRDERRALQ
jgi:hypothetical protein